MDKNKKPELISPAGDLEKLKIAFQYGADAVYASTPKFSMRSRGEIKFDDKTLKDGIEHAHSIGKKVYLTLNTFPHSSEIEEFKKHALKTLKLNPDAIICGDPGIVSFLRDKTDIPLHLSTQASTTNHLTAEFWRKQGISRIVLARELNLKDIKLISENCNIELESFVHGAMCMAYSGRCQISNYMTGRDPNKGECVQACRFKYKFREIAIEEDLRPGEQFRIYEDENGSYILNSKDLCMIEHVPDLIDAGISSFKIEGRLKSIYYVGMVTRAYRKAIDGYFDDHKKYEINKKIYIEDLKKTSSRGYTTGFYYQKPNEETNNYVTSRTAGEYSFVGIVTDYDKTKKETIIEARNKIEPGDEIEIYTPENHYKLKLDHIIDLGSNELNAIHAGYKFKLSFDDELPQNSFVVKKV